MREFRNNCQNCIFSQIVRSGDQYLLDGEMYVHVGPPFLFRGCAKIDPDNQIVKPDSACVTGEYIKREEPVRG